ncbi:MAG: hypothetical protein K9J13_09840 [Saprospiraceae bacterium]|nr:hypothetical protein [Saprospiraceae bacterium]
MKPLFLLLIVLFFLSCNKEEYNSTAYQLSYKCTLADNNDGNYMVLAILNFDTLSYSSVNIQNNNPWIYNASGYPGHHVYLKVFDFSFDTITSIKVSINFNNNLFSLAKDSLIDADAEFIIDGYLP